MRVHVRSFGCSTNLADGEVLAGCLSHAGFELAESVQSADLVIYSCCAVKGPTEDRMIALLKRVPQGKKLVVSGCLPLTSFDRLQSEVRFDGVVGPAAGSKIAGVVNRVLADEKVVELENALTVKPVLGLPRLRSNPVISLVPVSYGCLGSCTYCCVVFARGRLRSCSVEEIVERVKYDLASGAREFWLTSQDTTCYGRDLGANLTGLLKSVCNIEGDFRVRVGMMTPNFALEMLDELVEAFKDEKVFKFLHLPVQSGDDVVLKRMNRCYTAEDFRKIVNAFRQAIPNVTLATDVICGFPGETKQAFGNTLRVIGEVRPDIINISKFFGRRGTAAVRMQNQVLVSEIKRRSTEVAKLAVQISSKQNQRWLGWIGEILIDEKGKIPDSWVGRNFAYKPVAVKNSEFLLGKTLQIKVTKTFSTHLEAAII